MFGTDPEEWGRIRQQSHSPASEGTDGNVATGTDGNVVARIDGNVVARIDGNVGAGIGGSVGAGIDAGVVLGYQPAQGSRTPLVLGPGARLRGGTVIYDRSIIGRGLQTGHNVVIREDCEIGDDVSIWSGSVIDYGCRIGNSVKIHTNCYIAQFTEIGDGAFLAPGVTLANDLYPGQSASREVMSGPWIGPGAQLGVNVTVLPFVRIGAGALVGAGAVVTRDVRPGAVVFGNPATDHGDVAGLRSVEDRVQPASGSASRFRIAPRTRASADVPAGAGDRA